MSTASDLPLAPRAPGSTITQWLYSELRRAVVEGRLRRGAVLPPTRVLAEQYEISRRIVVNVFEQLCDEGYLTARTGSGTRVSDNIPEDFLAIAKQKPILRTTLYENRPARPFLPVQPTLSEFPMEVWARLEARSLRRLSTLDLGSADPAGALELRSAIADYVSGARGVTCSPDQIVITSGANHSLDLLARILIRPRDRMGIEDPGYRDAADIFARAGARVVPYRVDESGLCLPPRKSAPPRALYVTPAHQFPLGVPLRLDRRMELLRWTREAGTWILEDDYDSEFRFQGRPIPAMKSLEGSQHVFLLGTFNKALFPTLRAGYIVVPDAWLDPLLRLRRQVDRYPAVLPQRTLAQFLAEGHYGRYLRRVRGLYATRLAVLRDAVERRLWGALRLPQIEAGLSIPAFLNASISAEKIAANAPQLDLWTLRRYAFERQDLNGFVLGFAPFTEAQIRKGVADLAKAIEAG